MTSIKELQDQVWNWVCRVLNKANVDPDNINNRRVALHLLEEATEVCLAIRCDPLEIANSLTQNLLRQSRKRGFTYSAAMNAVDVGTEIADTLITAFRIASSIGLDAEHVLKERCRYNEVSEWDVLPSGDFRRIKKG